MKRKRSDLSECLIPVDIGLKIVSSLEAVDVCSLASCSRFWRDVCGYDHVWEPLCRDRWSADSLDEELARLKGWREIYVKKHKEMAAAVENKLADYLQQVSSFGLVEGTHYQKALVDLNALHLPFKEVEFLFFTSNIHLLLKLLALHYCILYLQVPVQTVRKMLRRCKIVNKRVCIRWSKTKRCRGSFYHFVTCSLGDLLVSGDLLMNGHRDLNYIGIRDLRSPLQVEISAA